MNFPPSSANPPPCLTKCPPSVALHQMRRTLNACGGPNETTTPRNVLPACGGPSENETFGCTGGADADVAADFEANTIATPTPTSTNAKTALSRRNRVRTTLLITPYEA